MFRSVLFNIVFVLYTAVWAVAILWVLLIPRAAMVRVITIYFRSLYFLEKHILGLDYEVKGRENLPAAPCLIALKHQSAWETFKLYPLFGDVAIVLKRELMFIPFWGWYQAKAGVIPLDRTAGASAVESLKRGAEKVIGQQRSIVIFPQGTRVAPLVKKPYKGGLGILYETFNLPVVPVALNAGVFWPRNSFIKCRGKITVEILPALPPGLPRSEMMQRLESSLEAASDRLAIEAATQCQKPSA